MSKFHFFEVNLMWIKNVLTDLFMNSLLVQWSLTNLQGSLLLSHLCLLLPVLALLQGHRNWSCGSRCQVKWSDSADTKPEPSSPINSLWSHAITYRPITLMVTFIPAICYGVAVSYTNESQQIKVGPIVFPSCCFTEDFWLLVLDSFKKLACAF